MGQAQKLKQIRKMIRKDILPEAQDEAAKLRLMQTRRPWWLPKRVYYWLSDGIINFKENMAFTEQIWLEYRCEKCGGFDAEKYLELHPSEDRFQAAAHSCEASGTVIISKARLSELYSVQGVGDELEDLLKLRPDKLPVFSGEKINNDRKEDI